MIERGEIARLGLLRQIDHWRAALERLGNFDELAAPAAWAGLERELSTELRGAFRRAIDDLSGQLTRLRRRTERAEADELAVLADRLGSLRQRYLRIETALDFYADAVNSRTNTSMRAVLSGLDRLAAVSMRRLLDPLGKPTPRLLTYVDKGLGASILKQGLRLWEPSIISPAAAVKIARHNLMRPTALVHETGHQVAHILGWNEDLAELLRGDLAAQSSELADVWSSWSSEIAADTFAFAHTGYAAVANLHDVLAGDVDFVHRFVPGDPHPVSYIRVLLNVQMCSHAFGRGAWNDLATSWIARYPLEKADPSVARVLAASMPMLPKIAALCLDAPLPALGGRPLRHWIDPRAVSPQALAQLEQAAGGSLLRSPFWIRSESLRTLALIGLRAAGNPHRAAELFKHQEEWVGRLAALPVAA